MTASHLPSRCLELERCRFSDDRPTRRRMAARVKICRSHATAFFIKICCAFLVAGVRQLVGKPTERFNPADNLLRSLECEPSFLWGLVRCLGVMTLIQRRTTPPRFLNVRPSQKGPASEQAFGWPVSEAIAEILERVEVTNTSFAAHRKFWRQF
jgi:hypothetical protein